MHMDPRKYNGAVFLGLNGVAVKSHGGTDSYGFANAISVSVDMVQYNFISDLRNVISKSILNF
jgi:glycerol-3-phosphate acyltransferase PlsX